MQLAAMETAGGVGSGGGRSESSENDNDKAEVYRVSSRRVE